MTSRHDRLTFAGTELPTAAMPVTDPAGLALPPRPYAPAAEVYAGDPKSAAAYWPGAALSGPEPVSGPDPAARGAFVAPGDAEPAELATEDESGTPVRVTVADIALAQHLETADARAGGALSYVDLARVAREWLAVNVPRRWPVERKVWMGALGAALATLFAGALTWAAENVPGMDGVPGWLGPLLMAVAPPLASLLLAYAARHTPRVVPVQPDRTSG